MPTRSLSTRLAVTGLLLTSLCSSHQAIAASELSYPQAEQTLSGNVAFGWSVEPDAWGYWLSVVDEDGKHYGNYRVYDINEVGATISQLPAGKPFRVELITIYLDDNNVTNWDTRKTYYFNAPAATVIAPLTDILGSNRQTFNWNPVDGASSYYWSLTDAFGNSWFNNTVGLQTQVTLDNLPVDGRELYSELYTVVGNNWDRVSTREFTSHTGATMTPDIWQPSPGTSWQWQLTGEINTGYDVEMYDIDLFDAPQSVIDTLQAQGRKVICYFSAGSSEDWRQDASSFVTSVKGNSNGWAGEQWLDIRAIDELAPVIRARLDLAVDKGCDGVEPDNVDGYTNATGFALTADDQLTFNRWLAVEAHQRGLSIGLKNDLEQIAELEPFFDWALNEQCAEYDECEMMMPFIDAGKAVFGVEYSGNPASYCPGVNALDYDWLIKDLDLSDTFGSCR